MTTDDKQTTETPSRRDFMATATNGLLTLAGLLGLGGLVRFLSYTPPTGAPASFLLGAVTDYPLGSRTILAQIPAVLIHDENGFSALSLVCTHLGCVLEDAPDTEAAGDFLCPCHGSRFSAEGAVLRGPARDDLPVLRVEITEDEQVRVVDTRT